MRWRSSILIFALAVVPAAEAATLKVDYRITLAGVTLGQADLVGAFEGERYDIKLKGQLTGLVGAFTGGSRGSAASAGAVGPVRLAPTGFSATGRSSSAERTVRMGVAAGNVTALSIEPPLEERPEWGPRVPVAESHRRGVIDPLSAMVAVTTVRGRPDDAANCERRIPVFDGSQRFDMVLSYADTKPLTKPGFSGPVLVCSVRYLPIAGHRPQRPSVKFMEDNRDISVWLAPVEGTRVLVPIRISLRTMLGTSVIEAERWAVE